MRVAEISKEYVDSTGGPRPKRTRRQEPRPRNGPRRERGPQSDDPDWAWDDEFAESTEDDDDARGDDARGDDARGDDVRGDDASSDVEMQDEEEEEEEEEVEVEEDEDEDEEEDVQPHSQLDLPVVTLRPGSEVRKGLMRRVCVVFVGTRPQLDRD